MVTNGFHACQSDTSLFVHHSATVTIYMLVYVDDVISTENDASVVANYHKLDDTFALHDLSTLNYFLGL